MNCNGPKFLYVLCRIEQSLHEIIIIPFPFFYLKRSQKPTSDKLTNLKYLHTAGHPF